VVMELGLYRDGVMPIVRFSRQDKA
jgi:hypothetical protein